VAWAAGDEVMWCYRFEVRPVRVVHDGPDALAVWLSSDTERLVARPAGTTDPREVPLAERFRPDLQASFVVQPWRGAGILKVVLPGAAWSAWRFQDDAGALLGWYGNLEAPHRRGARSTHTRDHVLDVDWEIGSPPAWKDEDEHLAAVQAGRFTEEEAAAHRRAGEEVQARMRSASAPFDGPWDAWQPPAGWGPLRLPDPLAARAGSPSEPVAPHVEALGL
jgi:hypothetical protein